MKGSVMVMHSEEEHEYGGAARAREWFINRRRISWGAILAGAFVTLTLFVTLQILGAGIGLSAVDLTGREVTSPRSLGLGAAIWSFITGLIALFIGGWVAGRLGWLTNKLDRVLHGLTVWALFYAAMFFLATTALGALASGGLSFLGGTASAAATTPQGQQAVQQTLQGGGPTAQIIQQEIDKVMGPGAAQRNPQAASALVPAFRDYLGSSKAPQDRQQLAQAITQNTGASEAQANQMINDLDRTEQQARQTGEQAANVTGGTLIGLAIAMLIGAVVAMLGSLLAPAPRFVPPYEPEAGARAEEHAYAAR